MKQKLIAGVLALALCSVVSTASACPPKDKAAKTVSDKAPCGAKTATTVSAKSPCSGAKTATTVADKTTPCGKSAATVSAKSPCSGAKAATTVADKTSPCSKSATTASAKSPCSGAKTATTVADKSSPCSKSAATVSAKSPCSGAKTATTVSAKGGCGKDCTKPCCKKAKTVAAKKKGCGGCSKSAKTAASVEADGGCPIAKKVNAVLTSMPTMKYRIGKETTGCSKSAAAMAEKAGESMKFVVGDDVIADEGEALVKLTALLEKQVASMQTVGYVAGGKCGGCPMTAKSIAKESGTKVTYRVGGIDFDTKADADKVAKLVSDAVVTVAMEYKVNGKSYGCSKMAGEKCKESGAKMTYVVGDKETGCKTSAARNLAEAKIRKIVETAAAASFSL